MTDVALWFDARLAGWECPAAFLGDGVQLLDGWQPDARAALARAHAGPRCRITEAQVDGPDAVLLDTWAGRAPQLGLFEDAAP